MGWAVGDPWFFLKFIISAKLAGFWQASYLNVMADVCSVKIFKLSVSKWVRKILSNGRRIDTFMTVDVL